MNILSRFTFYSIGFLLPHLIFQNAMAYPNFIGHGYKSCITCHYNPFGNGPINDYGRAVSATGIASRSYFHDKKPEDLIGKESGFLFTDFKQKHFRPFIGYRGLLLKNNYGSPNVRTDWINMQADLNIVLKFGEQDQWLMSGTMGYSPVPRSYQNSSQKDSIKEYRSREHYIAYRPTPEYGLYMGLMDKPYGIRLVEHTAYTRTTPLLTMNDQSHGLTFHVNKPKVEWGINYFVGNLVQDAELRHKGFSSLFEYSVGENTRPGFSLLSSKNKYLELMSGSAHLRTGLGHGNSLMLELGQSVKKPLVGTTSETKEMFGFFQNYLLVSRGFFILNSIEYYKNQSKDNYKIRFGPSIQYFPVTKVEFRFDLYNNRTYDKTKSSPDTWDFLAQLHLWL